MKEYIERAAAEQAIAAIMPSMSTPDGAGANDEMVFAAQEMCADALNTIRRIPAADVAEVRQGKIIETIKDGKMNRVFSCCGHDFTKLTCWYMPKYCPNCGARMDKGDEHEQ